MTNSKVTRTERRESRQAEKQAVREDRPAKLSWFEKQLANLAAKKIYNQIKHLDMKSWRTTLSGAIAALGSYLITLDDPAWLQVGGQVLLALGMLLMGGTARDNKVTSKEAGAE